MKIKGNINMLETKKVVLPSETHLYTRKLSDLKEFKDILVYKIDQVFNGKVLETHQGVTTVSVLKKYSETGIFKNTFKYKLVDLDERRDLLKKPKKVYIDDFSIEDPFTENIEIVDTKQYALLTYTHGKLFDYIGSYHAEAYYFDDFSHDITDSYYDLEELLEVLNKRSDVVLFKGGKNGKIIKRPYAHGKGKTIKFLWIPSEEDYKKCLSESDYLSLETVPEKIFGVKKLR